MLFNSAARFIFARASVVAVALFMTVAASAEASSDIVLHSADVTAVSGNWAQVQSASGADVTKLQSVDRGWSTTEVPLASPRDYFEVSFSAPAAARYHVWVRLRATGESKFNDSVWVQFSDALDRQGRRVYAIGSTGALMVNLATCSSCALAGWGWQDGAYWLRQESIVQFESSGTHRIRVQTREDGGQVDQIVLSPVTYMAAAPGPVIADNTILPRASSDAPVAAVPAPDRAAPAPAPAPAPASAPAPNPPAGTGGGSGPGSSATIPVVTWNVQVDDGSAAHARTVMRYLAGLSPRPRVLVIEEAHQSQYATYLDELRVQTGQTWSGAMLTHCAPGGWTGTTCTAPRDEGVAVLSSLPIIDSGTKWLPYADAYHSARAAVRVALDVNGTAVQVFGVHLQVGNASARNSSMSLLKAWAGGYASPRLAAGDFNADMDQIDTYAGMSPDFVDSWSQVGAGAGFTYGTPHPTMKLDYWFADASGKATVDWAYVDTSAGSLSDHFPVVASYTIH